MRIIKLKYRKPHQETIKLIQKNLIENKDYSIETEDKIKKLTKHENVKLVNSGNSAILSSMNNIKGDIIIPNQGAWHGFKQSARFLDKTIHLIDTEKGLVKKSFLDEIDNLSEGSGLFITSFAGYSGEQDMKSISRYCKANGIILIEDASGGIGDPDGKLSNGKYSDVIIGSAGSPKIVNAGSGGFISTDIPDFFKDSKFLLNSQKANIQTICGMYKEIDYANDNFIKTCQACDYIKRNLNKNIVHKDKRSLNIIFECENNKEVVNILRDKFVLDEHSMITICPNYNRLKLKGFSLEIKNLNYDFLSVDTLDYIIDICENVEVWN